MQREEPGRPWRLQRGEATLQGLVSHPLQGWPLTWENSSVNSKLSPLGPSLPTGPNPKAENSVQAQHTPGRGQSCLTEGGVPLQ